MNKSDARIAEAIILAQVASDGGKGQYDTCSEVSSFIPNAWQVARQGYSVKSKYILNAIRGINKSRNSIFRYQIKFEDDQNGYDSILVYFEFKLDGRRMQVSFHIVPREWTHEMCLLIQKCTRNTAWNGRIGGSQDACVELANYFFEEAVQ